MTISHLWKWTSDISELYFRFWFDELIVMDIWHFASTYQIWRDPESQEWVLRPHAEPHWPNFACHCSYRSWSICLPNLKFLASTVSEIWRGSQNSKSRSSDHWPTLFDLNVHFFRSCSLWLICIHTYHLRFLAWTVSKIWRRSRNSKTTWRDPLPTPLDLILHFSLVLLVSNMHAKLEDPSFTRYRDTL